MLLKSRHTGRPTQLHPGSVATQLGDALDQIAFDVELLDVDERGLLAEVEAALGFQVEAEDFVMAGKSTSHAPFHAFAGNAIENPVALEDFERLLGVTNAPGGGPFDAHGVVFVQQHSRDP